MYGLLERLLIALSAVALAVSTILMMAFLFSIPLWVAWNLVIPGVFGLTKISLAQAVGIMIVSAFLFKPSKFAIVEQKVEKKHDKT